MNRIVRVNSRSRELVLEELKSIQAEILKNTIELLSEQIRHGRIQKEIDREVKISQDERNVLDRIGDELVEDVVLFDLLLVAQIRVHLALEYELGDLINDPNDLVGKSEHEERDRDRDEHEVDGAVDLHALQVIHLLSCSQDLGFGAHRSTRVTVQASGDFARLRVATARLALSWRVRSSSSPPSDAKSLRLVVRAVR